MGGLIIFITAAVSFFIWVSFVSMIPYKGLLISLMIMLIIGLRDDLLELSPGTKLGSQLFPVAFLIVLQGARVSSFYTLVPIAFPGLLAWGITLFVILAITNSFNLIDGIDGLAGSLGLLSISVFGAWFSLTGHTVPAAMAFCFTGSLIGFLIYNWSPSKIFMGDTGSLIIGLLCSFFAISFLNSNSNVGATNPLHFNNAISFVASVLVVPLFDTTRVFIIRISHLQSPFRADKNHLHHTLLRTGLNHAQTTLVMVGFNTLFIILAYSLRAYPDVLGLALIIGICLLTHFILGSLSAKTTPANLDHT